MDCGRGSEQLQLRELGACRHTHTHTHTHIRTYTRSSFFLLSPPISFFLPPPCLSLFFPLFILWTVKKRSVEWESGKGGDSNTADLFFFSFFPFLLPSHLPAAWFGASQSQSTSGNLTPKETHCTLSRLYPCAMARNAVSFFRISVFCPFFSQRVLFL